MFGKQRYITIIVLLIALVTDIFARNIVSDTVAAEALDLTYISNQLDSYLAEQSAAISSDGKFSTLPNTPKEILYKRDSVEAYMNQMERNASYADEVPDKIDRLPLGVRKNIGNLDWTLMLTNLTVTSEGAVLSAYLRLKISQNRVLYFGAEGVKINSEGGISDMKLVLLGTVDVPLSSAYRLVLKGGDLNTKTGLATQPVTYAVVGCQGLKQINLAGDFELSRDVVQPINPSTLKRETDDEKTVKASFNVAVNNWNDMLVGLTLPAFEMKGLDGVVFYVRNATMDMSDTRNTTGMIFPKGYQDKYYAGNSQLWRGIYIQELDIMMPQQFAKKGGERPRFAGQCMIIDQQGVSGVYSVYADILPLDQGSASGWKFSVSYVALELEANKITKGGFGGKIVLPVSNKSGGKNELGYTAIISDQDEYLLSIKLLEDLPFDFMMATITLKPNSYINMALLREGNGDSKSGKQVFKPEAVLTGVLTVNASNNTSGGELKAKGLEFTELRLMTDAPYIRIKEIEYKGQIGFANFPVSIDSISVGQKMDDGKDCIFLAFNVKVSIADNKFKGDTRLVLTSYYDKPSNESTGNWKFNRLRVEEIKLKAEFSGLVIKGSVLFLENDMTYGNGFAGSVDIDYYGKFKIASSCMFGATTYRYWYVDARLDLPTGIPVVVPFYLNGFGGGAYSKMTKAPKGSKLPYVPDEATSFGVKALVAYSVVKKEVCKGDLMFEMAFSESGGVRYMSFYGSAELIAANAGMGGIVSKLEAVDQAALKATKPGDADKIATGNIQQVASSTNLGPSNKPSSNIFAYVGIQYNFETSCLDATSEVFINLGVLKGRGPNNRAGWMEMHIGPDKWYCYAGTPQDRLGITINLKALSLSTGSYFMVGSEMPAFPDPPQKVVNILGPDLYPVKNNVNATSLRSGSGFAFGLDIGLKTNFDFMILYANLDAGVGGDIMLRQYPDAHCEGSSSPLGINSWYANGRVYAYLEGEIGVKVDLMFLKARVPIINGAAAALLEGGGPNPTWAKGYMRVKFSVLGGKVSGDMQMKLSLGDECKIVSSSQAPVSFKIISDISPASGSTETDVFVSPQIAFNIAIGEPFEITDDNDNKKLFRVKINSLDYSSGGKSLVNTHKWTNGNQTLTITSENSLPPQSTIQMKVKVSFEVQDNGNWIVYKVNGSSPTEEQTISFTTGLAPDYIPHKNIAYMYPAHYQKNVYKNERNKGYVVLKQWQDYLLEGDTKTNKYVKITSTNGKKDVLLTPTITRSEKKIEFDLSSLQSQNAYNFSFVTRPKEVAAQTATSTTSTYGTAETGQYQVTNNQAQSVIKSEGEKELLATRFATSSYGSLADKIYKINLGVSNKLFFMNNRDYLNVRTNQYELFDSTEIFGTTYTDNKPLINYQSLLTDAYYKNNVYNTIYKDYPYTKAKDIKIKDRNPDVLGFPPSKAIYYDNDYALDGLRMPYVNGLVEIYRKDFEELEAQIVNQYVNGNQSLLKTYPQFFNDRFPEPFGGNTEQLEFKYVLPGGAAGSGGVVNYKR